MIIWWRDFLYWWCNFYLVEAHLCVGAFLPRCLDCLGPGGVGVGSCLSARRFLFKGIVVLCKSWYDKTWHSRKFSQHRPLWLHCTTGECNFSKYTREQEVKNIHKNTRKTKPNLLHYTGPLQHHLHHHATKDCCSLTLGLCHDSWSWFFSDLHF